MYKAIRYGVICVLLSACNLAEMMESDTRTIADQNDSSMWYALQGDWDRVYLYDASSGLYFSPWGDPYCHNEWMKKNEGCNCSVYSNRKVYHMVIEKCTTFQSFGKITFNSANLQVTTLR